MFDQWRRLRKGDAKPAASTEQKEIMRIRYGVVASLLTDVGNVREVNEDCGRYTKPGDPALLEGKGSLAVVADGMGGHSAGERASNLAVEIVNRVYYEDGGDAQAALREAFRRANNEVYEASVKDESLTGMGTTCTALVLQNGSAISAHVGDSRIYLVRGGEIYLMTEDHSMVMEMVKLGIINAEEARHHADKNVIVRALGTQPELEIAMWEKPFPVREGDRFLLCSDGLYDLIEDQEIKQIVLSDEPRAACERLIALAKQRGGHDNITVGLLSLSLTDEAENGSVRVTRELETVN